MAKKKKKHVGKPSIRGWGRQVLSGTDAGSTNCANSIKFDTHLTRAAIPPPAVYFTGDSPNRPRYVREDGHAAQMGTDPTGTNLNTQCGHS